MTESCEGTLKSPLKSFELGHVALAFVTLMLRNIENAAELEVGGGNLKKEKEKKRCVADGVWL